jgi:hypothetical protein
MAPPVGAHDGHAWGLLGGRGATGVPSLGRAGSKPNALEIAKAGTRCSVLTANYSPANTETYDPRASPGVLRMHRRYGPRTDAARRNRVEPPTGCNSDGMNTVLTALTALGASYSMSATTRSIARVRPTLAWNSRDPTHYEYIAGAVPNRRFARGNLRDHHVAATRGAAGREARIS